MSTATYERHGGVSLLALLLIAILLIAGVWLYNRHHSETIGDHVGRAIDAAPIVVGKVADEVDLKKAGNAIEDAGDKAGSALSKAGHATSEAVHETSNDIKAASDRQKAQDAQSSERK